MAVYNVAMSTKETDSYYASGYSYSYKALDGNLTTYAYQYSSSSGTLLAHSFDASPLQNYIDKGAVISAVRAKIYMSGGASHSVRLVTDATSTSSYTDCGDESVSFTAVEGWNSISFPIGKNYVINNINKLTDGLIGIRLYTKETGVQIYELQLEVECTFPDITVTTEVNPAEGGTVTGGGVYESGSTVTLTATPNRGYAFSHWQIGETVVGTENPISGSITTDATVTAVFIEKPSKVYCGTKKCSVYAGTKKVSVYVGTKKLS